MNILAFINILNIVVGGIIGVSLKTWPMVFLACALVGFGTNVIFDAIQYGEPFLHLKAGTIDFIGISIFGVIFHAMKIQKNKRSANDDV